MSDDLFANLLLLGLAGLLVWAAVGDIRTFNIPNELNAAIALGAPLFWWAADIPVWPDGALRVGVALIVFAVLAGAFWLGMMGGGDVKMAAAVLLWFPVEVTFAFLMIMSLAGGAVTLAALIRHRVARREGRPEVPYGVAISFAGLWLITPTISLPF
ncbi:MAG TPA: prepilin peptidase [Sphingomonadaceae bacterium]|nr:prepilin peptidase [Sphingomonadaceae bacterium]